MNSYPYRYFGRARLTVAPFESESKKNNKRNKAHRTTTLRTRYTLYYPYLCVCVCVCVRERGVCILPAATAIMIRDPETESGSMKFQQFLSAFFQAKGATNIFLVTTLLAFGVGSLLGLVRIALRKSKLLVRCSILTFLLLYYSIFRYLKQSQIATPEFTTSTMVHPAVPLTARTPQQLARQALTKPRIRQLGQTLL